MARRKNKVNISTLKELSKDELMVNLAFKTLCSSMEQELDYDYDKFEYEDLSKSDMNFLFDILVTNKEYAEVYLEDFAGEEETLYILNRSKDLSKFYLESDFAFGDFVDFSSRTMGKMVSLFYSYGLENETTKFFTELVDKVNFGVQPCDEDHFFKSIKFMDTKNKEVKDYMLKLKTLLVIS